MTRALLIAVICALALTSCQRRPARIGVLLPTSGNLEALGAQVLAGVRLAAAELPFDERPELIEYDAGSGALGAVMGYQHLVDKGATLVLGPLSTDQAVAVAVAARARRVPFVTPTATGDEVTRDNLWAFRFCATDAEFAEALAKFARFELQLQRVAVVSDLSSRWSVGLAREFGDAFRERNGRIVKECAQDPLAGRLPGLLDELAGERVDGIVVATHHAELMALVEGSESPELREVVLLGVDGREDPRLRAAVEGRFAGAYLVSHFSPEEPGVSEFVKDFRDAEGHLPDDPSALGYDLARALFSIWSVDASPDALRQRLLDLHHVPGVTGTVRMDPGGTPGGKSIVLEQLHDPATARFVRRLAD